MPRKQTGVLRDGSWNNHADNARGSQRNRNHPDDRNNNYGFRVVQSAHIPASANVFSGEKPRKVGGRNALFAWQ